MSDIITLPSVRDYTKDLIDAGFAIYPCFGKTTNITGKMKAAMMPQDDPYYKTGVPYDVFMDKYYREGIWIGVRCGEISGNLECLDFDNKFGDAKEIFREYVEIPDVRSIIETYGLFIEKTTSGGRHLVYRCNDVLTPILDGYKLARRLNKEKNKPYDLIETRTEGQYFVTYPSEGYDAVQGLSLLTMQSISIEERNFLIEMARAMNEYEDPKKVYMPPVSKGRTTNPNATNELRPGDDYDQSEEGLQRMVEMLKASGWRHLGSKYWQRPGKDDGGISATLGHVAPNVFYVFSSNAEPFEPNRCYKPFGVMALLYFNGDFSEAASVLAKEGYGTRTEQPKELPPNAKDFKKAMRTAKDVIKRLRHPSELSSPDISLIATQGNLTIEEAQECFDEMYKRNRDLLNFDSKHSVEQAEIMIRRIWDIKTNVIKNVNSITKRKDLVKKEYTPDDIYLNLKKSYHKITKSDVDSILNSSFTNEFNPIHDYFNSLPEYKVSDPDYIQEYASYFQCQRPEDQPFWEMMFKKHLVRALHCALRGIENRYIVILLGPQEDGKSTYLRSLCFDEDYYTQKDMFASHDAKDNMIAQFENFFWQHEEMDRLSAKDLNKQKAFISTAYDKVRDFYGKKAQLRIRICTHWGTGNKDNILTDETGNSRYLVFRGRIISHDYNNKRTGICKVPLDRLWSQAFYLYKQGEKFEYDLTPEEKAFRDGANKKFEVINDVESCIMDYFVPGYNFWSVTKIARYLAKESANQRFNSAQLITGFKKINERNAEYNLANPDGEQKKMFEMVEQYGQKGFNLQLLEFIEKSDNPF